MCEEQKRKAWVCRERQKEKQETNRLNTVAMYDNHIFEIYICSIRLVHIKSPCIWCIFVDYVFFFSHPTIKRAYIKNLLNDTQTHAEKRNTYEMKTKTKRDTIFIFICINNQKKNIFFTQQHQQQQQQTIATKARAIFVAEAHAVVCLLNMILFARHLIIIGRI